MTLPPRISPRRILPPAIAALAIALSLAYAAPAQAALADSPSADPTEQLRFQSSYEQKRLELKAKGRLERPELLAELERVAEELILEFPYQPGGYGLLLSVAKGSPPEDARRLALRLLDSPADGPTRQAAARVLAQKDLIATQVEISGVDLSPYEGRSLVIYSWSSESPPPLSIMSASFLPEEDFAFIGICLDQDAQAGLRQAADWELPGDQFCDGAAMRGPLAESLALTMVNSVYLVDSAGRLFDTDAHRDFGEKVASLMGSPLSIQLQAEGGAQ